MILTTAYRKLFLLMLVMGVGVWGWGQRSISLVRFDDTKTYFQGGSISVHFKPVGVFPFIQTTPANSTNFRLQLLNASDNSVATNDIGSERTFFVPVLNGTLPISTANGNYKIKVIADSAGVELASTVTNSFTVQSSASFATTTIANPSPNLTNTGDVPCYSSSNHFGYLNKASGSVSNQLTFDITNYSNSYTYQVVLVNHATNAITNITVDVSQFGGATTFTLPSSLDLGYYTVEISKTNGGKTTTNSFIYYNNTGNTALGNLSSENVCINSPVAFTVDQSVIEKNYAGSFYLVNYGDNTKIDTFTQARFVSSLTFYHSYSNPTCSYSPFPTGGKYSVSIQLYNKGLTSTTCNSFSQNGNGTTKSVNASTPPTANFYGKNPICLNDSAKFTNTTQLGYYGMSAVCTRTATFVWTIKSPSSSTFSSVSNAWIDANFNLNVPKNIFSIVGVWQIKLTASNPQGCTVISEIIKDFCVQPDIAISFNFNDNGTFKDSIVDCAPKSFVMNNTTSTVACGETSFTWVVMKESDRSVIAANAGIYTYTSSTNNTSQSPTFNFTASGRYLIKLTASNSCKTDTLTRKIIINGTTGLTLPANITYCANGKTIDFGADVKHKPNYSSSGGAGETYNWTITGGAYSFTSGSAASAYPVINFTDNVTYTVSLTFTNNCGTNNASQTITFLSAVTANVGVNPKTVTICYNDTTLQLNGSASGSYASLVWSTNRNGTFNNSAIINPIYKFGTTDRSNFTTRLILTVTPTSSSCQPVTDTLNVIIRPRNQITSVASKSICNATNTNYIPTSSQTGSTFSWASSVTSGTATGNSAIGSGNISDVLTNSSNSIDAVVKYTITPIKDGCDGDAFDVLITVKPKPELTATPSSIVICNGSPLTVTLSSTVAGSSFTWASSATGNISGNTNQATATTNTSFVHNLNTTSTTDVILTYTINVNGPATTSCVGDAKQVIITVKPGASSANAGLDQKLCNATTATLAGNNPSIGSGTWVQVGSATATITNPSAYNTGVTGLQPDSTYRFVWTIAGSGSCGNSTDTVDIINRPDITIANAGIDNKVCDFNSTTNNTYTLAGNINSTRVYETGTWSFVSAANGATINNTTSPTAVVTFINAGTYELKWTISNGGACTSTSDNIIIKVYAKPIGGITANSTSVCKNINSGTINLTGQIGKITKWQYAIGSSNIWNDTAVVTSNISYLNLDTTRRYRAIVESDGVADGCTASTDSSTITTITVNPISVGGITLKDTSVCGTTNNGSISLVNHVGSIIRWEFSTNGGSIWNTVIPNNTTATLNFTNLAITTRFRAVVKSGVCAEVNSAESNVVVNASTGPANAGPDVVLCASNTYIMQAVLATGSTGSWTQFSGTPATITTPSSATTQITGLLANNTYKFIFAVTGVVGCPGTVDTVTIINYASLVNQINNTPQTICATQSITINGQVPTGGTGTYTYQWQQSIDNITWVDVAGQTNQNLTIVPTANVYVRRKVVSLPCTEFSAATFITVQPAITNNTISADQAVCINNPASTIIGSVATGGNGIVTYQWQQSINNGVTWVDINLATLKDYNPATITITTKYRRVVSTNLCFGTQGNTSNVITITINPDAEALYTFTKTKDCAPFNINSSIIQPTIYAAQNSLYNWFANGISIGMGTTFPGYILTTPGDSVIIKLVATSKFGCKNDSVEHKFYSVPKPATAFTLSDTVGCGPLTVSFVNTTPNGNLFTYLWNFGNTITSTLEQPNAVTFATNPTYNDTAYIVKLNAITACETITVSKSIRVKSKPKAIFTPDKSTGCSPMTVQFANSSKGIGVSYIWNFDDGTALVPTTTNAAQTHTFITGVQDTFNVKLIAINECGNDTLIYKIVVAPNTVHLDFAVNGNQTQGCKPHAVGFINASSGATNFQWNFGDGNFNNTIKNIDTVLHTYTQAGTYTVTLKASNGCSDTTSTEIIKVFNTPTASFIAMPLTACIGDVIQFTNQTDTSTSLLWNFRDNTTSTLTNPAHVYTVAGTYSVQLKAFRQYSSGLTCLDSISKQVTIVSKLPGLFTVTDTVSNCVPFTATFTNQSLPSSLTNWNFGGSGSATGNTVTHTFTQVGTYIVTMNATSLGGCNYEAKKTVVVRGPAGTWQYDNGNICNITPVRFTVTATGIDSIKYSFGDGMFLTTTSTIVYHTYTQAGLYLPTATLYSSISNNCTVLLQGVDTIKVDFVKAGYKFVKQENCGSTNVVFTDTSRRFLNITSWQWKFGDGATSSLQNPQHIYTATNTWAIQLITTTASGCTDTAIYSVFIKVNNKPSSSIVASLQGCATQVVNYTAQVVSVDNIAFNSWSFSNGLTVNGTPVTNAYTLPGTYAATLISGTIYGCTDTVSQNITINPTPIIVAPSNQLICKGQSLQLNATGASTVTWAPINGTLSCTTCATAIATPLTTTQYIATGTNSFGCSAKDSVIIAVAQPINIVASTNDTICIGNSSQLSVTGASTYAWSPSTTLLQPNTAAPLATPILTTRYQVIGFDNHNCFQDTAYVTVAVGQYPTIDLGIDKILATGTLLPLASTLTNGPITKWQWAPTADLSCNTCPQPIATIKRQVCYTVTASNLYKCIAKDTICIKVFCEGTQVFIPNGFTPDGDGINDVLMVRGSGIKTVKTFRIFNRWGQVVFERNNISPNDATQGWDGRINGAIAPPEVYVYTCEVVCENDVSYTYKGNVAILK